MSYAYYEPTTTDFGRSSLKGRSCLITGAATGLGLSVAQAFASAGAYLTILDILPHERGQEVVASLNQVSNNVAYVQCDVASFEDQVKAFKAAIQFSPSRTLDVVAIFAGRAGGNNLVDSSTEDEANLETDPKLPSTSTFEVNMLGSYYSAFLALHYFRLKPEGPSVHSDGDEPKHNFTKSLIFVSSLAAYMDYPDTMYTGSKFGIRGIFRSIRNRAWTQQNVRCNNIAPWHMRTAQTVTLEERFQAQGLQEGKGYTFTKPGVLIEAVCRCAVDESLTGRSLAIMPEGYLDLKEDFEHGYAGLEVTEALQRRYDAGDQMA